MRGERKLQWQLSSMSQAAAVQALARGSRLAPLPRLGQPQLDGRIQPPLLALLLPPVLLLRPCCCWWCCRSPPSLLPPPCTCSRARAAPPWRRRSCRHRLRGEDAAARDAAPAVPPVVLEALPAKVDSRRRKRVPPRLGQQPYVVGQAQLPPLLVVGALLLLARAQLGTQLLVQRVVVPGRRGMAARAGAGKGVG